VLRAAAAGHAVWLPLQPSQAPPPGAGLRPRPAGAPDGAVLLLPAPKAYAIAALICAQSLTPDSEIPKRP
jgi:hypothetical protein